MCSLHLIYVDFCSFYILYGFIFQCLITVSDKKKCSLKQKGQAERAGAVQPGEEKTPGRPYCGLSLPEGGLQESWRGTFYKGM